MFQDDEYMTFSQKFKGHLSAAFEIFMVLCFVSLLGAGAYVILSAESAEADVPLNRQILQN